MAKSLDSLTNNLVRVSGLVYNLCKESCEITHIDESYVAHEKCKECQLGYSKCQLNKDFILNDFGNLRVEHNDEQFRLLLRKGVYLYEYMTSWKKFTETKLPLKEAFHNFVKMSDISESDYEHAQKVWRAFDSKNLGEYHNLYLKTDIILLANVFEKFRNDILESQTRSGSFQCLDWLGKQL